MKVIVAEKPSVATEYARVLGVPVSSKNGYMEGNGWIVTWTVGHLVALSYPEKYDVAMKEWKLETLPFLPNSFKYEVMGETSRQFAIIKKLYNRADVEEIYYAGDAGREGLYIQMLVRMLAGHNPNATEKVVWIDSQTEDEILRGISQAKSIKEYETLSDAGYVRAIADYLMGINFSRMLSLLYSVMLNTGSGQKHHKPISIGRVMTCVLGMVVKREREIRSFRVTDFFRIKGNIDVGNGSIECEWRVTESSAYYLSPKLYSEFGFLKENDALELIDNLADRILIKSVDKKLVKKNAPLFFNLAELQSECTKVLHLSPSATLSVAQSLYEKKMTTYPRTDARVLSSAVAKEIQKNLSGLKNSAYKQYIEQIESSHYSLNQKFVDDSKVTDHYAIIPTGKMSGDLSEREQKVYDMIVRRFLAGFYPPAEYETVKLEGIVGPELFIGNGKALVKKGYLSVLTENDDQEESNSTIDFLKDLKQGESYRIQFSTKKGATEPPKRYTSGSMILAMENAGNLIENDELREQIKTTGIGTSATRADIIDKLIKQNYIELNAAKQILTPTNFGEMIYEVVDVSIPDLLQPEITAEWERSLEQIETGQLKRKSVEEEYYRYIRSKCNEIMKNSTEKRDEVMKKIYALSTNRVQTEYKEFDSWNTKIKCPLCGDEVETMAWGFKCKSNQSKNEGCNFTVTGDLLGHRLLTNELHTLLSKGKVGPFYDFVSQKNKPFAAYMLWDDEIKKIKFEMTEMPWAKTDLICPKCGGKVVKQGNFFKCENYVDKEHGCSFWVGKIAGKSISEKIVTDLIKTRTTELIKGFKNKEGNKFDAFLVLNEKNDIEFRFPNAEELVTDMICPNCGGRIMETSKGFKCEHYKYPSTDTSCTFYAGTFMGHSIKKKELEAICRGTETEPVTLKNSDKKSFEARLFWNQSEKRICLKFDENKDIQINAKCPICKATLYKNRYGYFCKGSDQRECKFRIGAVAGILIDEVQVKKLVEQGKTELISGFKPKEKGKNPFSAYLVWDEAEKGIRFQFPSKEEQRKLSEFSCPICYKKMYETNSSFSCDCNFRLYKNIASVEIKEEQIRKLLVTGKTDPISGFFSPKTRKLFTASLVLDKEAKKVGFQLATKNNDGGGKA